MKLKETIGILQFGCAKNLIDMELMLGLLTQHGYKYSLNPDDKKIKTVIINTCSFIQDAEKECIKSIIDMINQGKRIILTGCLVQKYKEELPKLLPEIHNYIGVCEYDKIIEAIENKKYINISKKPSYTYREDIKREQITVGSSSYIKISEGCYYNCGYCVIPQLRGKYSSRKIEDIVKEAVQMAEKGVSEICLIAQDTTSYGIDIYGKTMLAEAIAAQTGCDMYTMDLSKVGTSYINETAKNIRKAFEFVSKKASKADKPVILFLDEMDSILSKRMSDNTEGSKEDNKSVSISIIALSLSLAISIEPCFNVSLFLTNISFVNCDTAC